MKAEDRAERKFQEEEVMDFLRERAQEEGQKLTEQKNRSVSLSMAREKLFLEQFEEIAKKYLSKKVGPAGYALKKDNTPKSRYLNVVISDTHFQSCLDPREVPIAYGSHEEARRLAKIVLDVAEYKIDHRKETILNVHLLGDIIQGQLHDPRDGAPLAQQSAAAMSYLTQAISFWSTVFPKVHVYSNPGNHGRNTVRHQNRATNQKWDAVETTIYYGAKLATQHLKNVKFEIPYTPYYVVDMFKKLAFFTHGDTVFNPGYPGRNIDVASLRKQAAEINSSREEHERYFLFVVGHVHTGSIIHLPSGVKLITNGCLIPPDAYGLSIGLFDGSCGQYLWETVDGHFVGDARFLEVDHNTDRDATLEKIVKPFEKF